MSEELMFRGVLFHGATARFSAVPGVLITAAIFGPIHALNGIITGNFGVAALQAVFAMGFGIWAGALRLRTESVLPLIVIHALWDGLLILAGTAAAAGALLSALLLTSYGMWLLLGRRWRVTDLGA